MIDDTTIRLARAADAPCIARMSRDFIEQGLGWGWTSGRVMRSVLDRQTNTAVIGDTGALTGFAIMRYADDHAHLLLMAVEPAYRRRGIGSALLRWLEDSARAAGAARIILEARRSNDGARLFYNEHGYHEQAIVGRMYRGIEDGVTLQKWLRVPGGD